jgi:hypothetical protein
MNRNWLSLSLIRIEIEFVQFEIENQNQNRNRNLRKVVKSEMEVEKIHQEDVI